MRKPRSHILSSATILLSFLAVAGGLVWAAFAEVDQVSRAQGQLIPTGRVQVLQSSEGGTIDKILVHEGDRVTRGQLLVTLDSRQAEASAAETRNKIAALRIANARIEAELADEPTVNFPSELLGYADLIANQMSLFQRRRAEQKEAMDSLGEVVQTERQDYDAKLSLAKKGLVAKTTLLAQQRVLAEATAQLDARKNRYMSDLQFEYAKNGEELAMAQELLALRQASLDDYEIRAPVDGIVKNVRLTTVGGVFRPGDEVMQIVPMSGDLLVEAKLPPSAIGTVYMNQPTTVKFDAYDSGLFGAAKGRVTYISADTLTEMRAGMEQPFYRVHVSVDPSSMHDFGGVKIDLQPGMTATVEMRGVKNTVLNYLLKPVTKTLAESFSER